MTDAQTREPTAKFHDSGDCGYLASVELQTSYKRLRSIVYCQEFQTDLIDRF